MQNLLNKFNGKAFKYCGKTYKVKETKIVNQKAVILTDGQSFVKTMSELEAFVGDVEIFKIIQETFPVKSLISGSETGGDKWVPSDEIVLKSSPMQAEIVVAESNSQKVSNKLMEVFEALSDRPTEATYKKASAMVNVANSIVNIQMAQIKFLSLKK